LKYSGKTYNITSMRDQIILGNNNLGTLI